MLIEPHVLLPDGQQLVIASFFVRILIPSVQRSNPQSHTPNTKVEYHAMANTVAELPWLSFILKDLHIPVASLSVLYCDNLSSLHLNVNPVFHTRNKHIELDHHFKVNGLLLDILSLNMSPLLIKLLTSSLSHSLSRLCLGFNPNFASSSDKVCGSVITTIHKLRTTAMLLSSHSFTTATLTRILGITRLIHLKKTLTTTLLQRVKAQQKKKLQPCNLQIFFI